MFTFRSLRKRNYRLFFCGQLISVTGTWVQNVAQAWLVLQLSGSPLALGTISSLQFLPVLLLGLVGGAVADRLDKRRTLMATQAAFAGLAALLGLLAHSGAVRIWHIALVAATFGVVSAVDTPVRQAFPVEMVGEEDLPNAVALNSAVFNSARSIGPALGGATMAVLGVAACFWLNAASYLAVIAALGLMDDRQLQRSRTLRQPLGQAVREGLRYALHSPDAALALGLLAVIGTFGMNFQILIPALAKASLGLGPVGFGLMTSVFGAGSLAGALAVATIARATRRLLVSAALAFGLLQASLGLPLPKAPTAALLFLAGFAAITYTATTNSLLQLTAPDHLRGRVMSLYTLLFFGTTPIGAPAVGALAAYWGPRAAFLAAGGISAAAALASTVLPRLRLIPPR